MRLRVERRPVTPMTQQQIDKRFDELCTMDPTPATIREMERLVNLHWDHTAERQAERPPERPAWTGSWRYRRQPS